jgi:hypothetical protein
VKRVLIAAALFTVPGLSAIAKTSSDMDCSHYMAMNEAGQTAMVNSMRSKMPSAHKMPSSHGIAKKVAAICKDHPGMIVDEVMENAMPRTSVMPR